MNRTITRDEFAEAINQLQNAKLSEEERNFVNQTLVKTAEQPTGWLIAKEMLGDENANNHMYFSSASLLKNKIRSYFHELGPNDYGPLFTFIINLLIEKGTAMRSSKYQLHESLIIIYLRIFQQEQDLVDFLVSKFSAPENRNQIFEILSTIPGLIFDERIVVEDEVRSEFDKFMIEKLQPQVLQILHQRCSELLPAALNSTMEIQKEISKIFSCFVNWMLENSPESIKTDLVNHSIIALSFKSMMSSDMSLDAKEVLEETLYLCKDPQKYPKLYDVIVECMHQSIVANNVLELDDDRIVEAHLSVFSSILFNAHKEMMNPSSNGKLVDIFRGVVTIYTNIELELGAKSAYVLGKICKYLSAYRAENRGLVMDFISKNNTIFFQIISSSLQLSKMSPKQFALMNKQDKNKSEMIEGSDSEDEYAYGFDSKSRDREEIKSLISRLVNLIGFKEVALVLASFVKRSLAELGDNQENQIAWIEFEGELFLIRSALDRVPCANEHTALVQEILQLILQLNCKHLALVEMILKIIKKSTNLLGDRSDIIQMAFSFASDCLKMKELQYLAADAISSLCQKNSSFVTGNLQEFMNFYLTACDQDGVVKGIAAAVDDLPDEESKSRAIGLICEPFAAELNKIAQLPETDDQTDKRAIYFLKKITLVVENIKPMTGKQAKDATTPHALVGIFEKLFPIIKMLLQKYGNNTDVIEKLCKMVKITMKCLKYQFTPFFEDYYKIVMANYQKNPIATYMYTVENALTVFHSYPEYQVELTGLFNFMCNRTYQELVDFESFVMLPDLVDDFFGMITRFFRFLTIVPLTSPTLEKQLQMSIIGIGIQHKASGKALYQYVEEVFAIFREDTPENQNLHFLLVEKGYGFQMVRKLFIQFYLSYPTSKEVVEYKKDSLMACIRHLWPTCISWIVDTLPEIPLFILSENEKVSFIENLKKRRLAKFSSDNGEDQTREAKENKAYYDEFLDKYVSRCYVHYNRGTI